MTSPSTPSLTHPFDVDLLVEFEVVCGFFEGSDEGVDGDVGEDGLEHQ